MLLNGRISHLTSFDNGSKEAVVKLLRANGAGPANSIDTYKISKDEVNPHKLARDTCYAKVVGFAGRNVESYYYCTTECDLAGAGS